MKNFEFWKNIWEQKGTGNRDILDASGYEHLPYQFSSKQIVNRIDEICRYCFFDTILEIGCGAGFLSKSFSKNKNYVGVDYSESLVCRNKKSIGKIIFQCEANKIFFPSKSFDHVFCFGVFQYFPNLYYANQVICEMERLAIKSIFIGDLKTVKTHEKHMNYPKVIWNEKEWTITPCIYDLENKERYNVHKRLDI